MGRCAVGLVLAAMAPPMSAITQPNRARRLARPRERTGGDRHTHRPPFRSAVSPRAGCRAASPARTTCRSGAPDGTARPSLGRVVRCTTAGRGGWDFTCAVPNRAPVGCRSARVHWRCRSVRALPEPGDAPWLLPHSTAPSRRRRRRTRRGVLEEYVDAVSDTPRCIDMWRLGIEINQAHYCDLALDPPG